MEYVGCTVFPLSGGEEARAKLLTSRDIDPAIKQLLTPIPEYASWVKRGCEPGNPNMDGARKLRILADHHIYFSKEQIDSMLPALEHVSFWVRCDVQVSLRQIFGIGLIIPGRGDWPGKQDENTRKPYVNAWQRFWSDNRDRYDSVKPYIINGLSLDAEYENPSGLRITITNQGTSSVHFWVEAAGKLSGEALQHEAEEMMQIITSGGHPFPFSIILEKEPIYPTWPRGILLAKSQDVSGKEPRQAPDRDVHCQEIVIPAGTAFKHKMKLDEAFPKINFSGRKLIVRYDYGLWAKPKNGLWVGELRSVPIRVP